MTTSPRYDRYEGQDAAAQLDTFLAVYEEVYAEPPYSEGPSDVRQFIDHYDHHTRRPGMRLILARTDNGIAGFAYGFLLPADTRWWANVQEPLPCDLTREDGRRTWVIIELAVRKEARRRGIATALHT